MIIELNGTKYLNVEVLVVSKTDSLEVSNKIIECEGIVQGIKELNRGGFFLNGYAIINVLIPEGNIHKFNNYKPSEPKKESTVLESFVFKFNCLGKIASNIFTNKKS